MGSQVRILSIRLGDQPSLFRLADYTSPPCDVSEKSTAMRMWCSGSTPASQAGDRGFEPRHPLHPENQNNGSDPLMGLAAVLPWGASGEAWTNSLGMGALRQGTGKHAIAPVAQRKSVRLVSGRSPDRVRPGARSGSWRERRPHATPYTLRARERWHARRVPSSASSGTMPAP